MVGETAVAMGPGVVMRVIQSRNLVGKGRMAGEVDGGEEKEDRGQEMKGRKMTESGGARAGRIKVAGSIWASGKMWKVGR